jgi:Domain of unknown function (DUF5753)
MFFILDESVLRRQVGRSSRTMVRQLERLKERAAEPNITMRVLTFAVGAHPGMSGNFIQLEFDAADLDDLVHLESVDDITIRDDADLIARYLDRFEKLEALSLSPEDSVVFLDKVIAEMSPEGGGVGRTESPRPTAV